MGEGAPGVGSCTLASSEKQEQAEVSGHVTGRAAAGKGGHRVRFGLCYLQDLAEAKQD